MAEPQNRRIFRAYTLAYMQPMILKRKKDSPFVKQWERIFRGRTSIVKGSAYQQAVRPGDPLWRRSNEISATNAVPALPDKPA
jgi:hypothetical protein